MKKLVALMLALLMLAGTALAEGILDTGTDRVIVTDWALTEKQLVMLFQNVSGETIPDMEVQIVVRDSSGNIVETFNDGHDVVLAGSTVCTQQEYYSDIPENCSVEVTIDTEKYTNKYVNHAGMLTIESNSNDDGKVFLEVTNGDEVEIEEIEIVVVYYAGGKIIGASEAETTHVAAGKTEVLEFSAPTNADYERIDYDRYEVIVNQAHTF